MPPSLDVPAVPAPVGGQRHDFSVGICATGEAVGLSELLRGLLSETFPSGFALRRVVVVASGCTRGALEKARNAALVEPRVQLVEQPNRRGKADAVNTIIGAHEGEFLVFVNSDALPEHGAVSKLLVEISNDAGAAIVSGSPLVSPGEGLTSRMVDFMWMAHNTCALDLNHMGISNQCSDELMVVRSSSLGELPEKVVNDGAYIAGQASLRGRRIRFLPEAGVRIDVPSRPADLIRQRRRVIFGHLQIWGMIGTPPKTVESLMMLSPATGLGILVKTLARSPRLVAALPSAVVSEGISFFCALWDTLRSSERHVVWERYGD